MHDAADREQSTAIIWPSGWRERVHPRPVEKALHAIGLLIDGWPPPCTHGTPALSFARHVERSIVEVLSRNVLCGRDHYDEPELRTARP